MDLLSDILSHLKLKGTLYFRTSFTSPWSIRVPAYEDVARFHFAHRGRCLVRVEGEANPVPLEQGDLIIITRGAPHNLFCDPTTEHQVVLLDDVVRLSGFTGQGTLVWGELGTHHETQLVCGHFSFDPDASHPLIDHLPNYIHIANYAEMSGSWMESTLAVIGAEAGRDQMGSSLIALKMSEIIFAQALRTYLTSEDAHHTSLAGFADPVIAATLSAIHKNPSDPLSLDDLSRLAGMSRTAFATRFSQTMQMTPLAYITRWRMQIARQMLIETAAPVIEIALGVGYQSEASFSRIFKKHFAVAPATYRRQRRAA